ncbi:hypothetical protein SEUCBS140593_010444 [Sporothrix eucalyptigena]|uniref:NYN domain-containing protein n=1 Tax=Sporothrix eucalyptigena TaxID=1812306 RepID=A0ABP0D2F9_9PEZI
MPAASDTTSESGYNVEHVHVYIDNAHLWMHEPRLYFTRDGCWEWNPLWRFDAGRLQAILEQESGLEITKSPYSFHYYLHGPAPPVDTIWGDPSCDVHPGQRPDFINAQITADSVTTAVSASFDETRNTFIIVSGDAGLSAAVTRIQKCGYPVHVWSWRSGLTAKHDEGTVQVHFLDDHFARLVSCDTTFCVDPTALSPSSLVVLDPLPHADKIQDCVAKLRAPVYQYAVADPRPKTSSQDLVITPAFQAHNWGADGSGDDLQATKMQLEGCGCAVLTYTEYVQQHCEDGRGKLVVSNQFKELPASLWHADYEDDGAEANGHDSAACPERYV